MKRKFTKNILLAHEDGKYYVYKVQNRLDPKIYLSHQEEGKLVISRLHEEITPDEAREYFLSMKQNLEKTHGIDAAEKAYADEMTKFKLIEIIKPEKVEEEAQEVVQEEAEEAVVPEE